MKKQRESVTLYRLEWIQGGEEHVEEHAIRARATGRFEELKNRKDVVEIEFVKVGPNGREGIDFWLDEAERERRLDDCIASEGYEDPAEEEHRRLDREAAANAPEGLWRSKRQPIEPDPAYEAAHSTAHDLIQRLVERLHELPAPDSGYVQWHHVKVMNEVNRALFAVIEIVEKEIT